MNMWSERRGRGPRWAGAALTMLGVWMTLGASTAQATCLHLPDTLTLRRATCEPIDAAPDKPSEQLHDAALPLTFTYTGGIMCCAGSAQSCSRQIEPLPPAALIGFAGHDQGRLPNGVRMRTLLEAPDARGAKVARGVREAGIQCEGAPLLELTGGPLKVGTLKLADHATLTTRQGLHTDAARSAQLAALSAAKPGPTLPYLPPAPPKQLTLLQALDLVRRSDQLAQRAPSADVAVALATGLIGLDSRAAAASPLLPVYVTWTSADSGPVRLPGLVVRLGGALCLGELSCFETLAAQAGLFEAKSPLKPREWAALYLMMAGEAPTRFVDRDKRDATVAPAKLLRHDALRVTLSACYNVADDDKTRCFEQHFTRAGTP